MAKSLVKISDRVHKKHLMMYYDKRFQTDPEFALIALNQEQIIEGSRSGAFLSEKPKFKRLIDMIAATDKQVFADLAEKMDLDGGYHPQTDDEKRCFKILGELDMVTGHVTGSMTAKRYQRNELWSLMSYLGAPSWFITFAPADYDNPLCLYYAGQDQDFVPSKIKLMKSSDRLRQVINNPTASARFFHHMANIFTKEILRWQKEEPGLFGFTNAFYGTVEQQGRLTLHLHLLLWIKGAISPEQIKERLLSGDSEFQRKMIEYIDSCVQGYLPGGSLNTVTHTVDNKEQSPGYVKPTMTLPAACTSSTAIVIWNEQKNSDVDDLLLKANIHECNCRCFVKGGKRCKSRFPREVITQTAVDDTGYIHLRHDEPQMNSVNHFLTYMLRCNTDVSCLLTGTAIKAVMAYATDYITKPSLKTPSMFSLIRKQLDRAQPLDCVDADRHEKGRKIITSIVNSFTSKYEIGAPLASSYLLDLPDHYKSHTFRHVYWRSFVKEVMSVFPLPNEDNMDVDSHEEQNMPGKMAEYKIVLTTNETAGERMEWLALTPVTDYMYRPLEHEQFCLYDWIRLSVKSKHNPPGSVEQPSVSAQPLAYGEGVENEKFCRFTAEHPQSSTYAVKLDNSRVDVVPNFLGGPLPRRDAGDRELYCSTMLTLFKPWRSGHDLKSHSVSWEEIFESHEFSVRQNEIMDHFNLRYECLDARDDYSSRRKVEDQHDCDSDNDNEDKSGVKAQPDDDESFEDPLSKFASMMQESTEHGPSHKKRLNEHNQISEVLKRRGWTSTLANHIRVPSILDEPSYSQSKSHWTKELDHVKQAKSLSQSMKNFTPSTVQNPKQPTQPGFQQNDNVRVVDWNELNPPTSFYNDIGERVIPSELIDPISKQFTLNEDQDRAFKLVANHVALGDREQFLMYLGGMAGTGKSQVIKALTFFFKEIGQEGCLLLLAPTGSAASQINGHTYHSALGIIRDSRKDSASSAVQANLTHVRYVFVDEVSMISCDNLRKIAALFAKCRPSTDKPFGGFHMILAGDFAQLPPVQQAGASLFSRKVGLSFRSGTTPNGQNQAIGKSLWHQFTTVVMLKENMRQTNMSDADTQLRTALMNMRYAACTKQDLEFLRSLTASNCPGRLQSNTFRHTSVITGLNSHRDAINELGCKKFAADTQQELLRFYSVDKASNDQDEDAYSAKKRQPKGKRRRQQKNWTTSHISQSRREVLWNLSHKASDNAPGCLSICRNMPVIIKKNIVTECGVTNGAEGTVWDWTSHTTAEGYNTLDTLFIKLDVPFNNGIEIVRIHLPGLPPNVVPIVSCAQTVKCHLPSDEVLTIQRTQVPVLPNFAMTDYNSQGKTRKHNVVDLNNLKSHQAYYTALSRSSDAAGTLILQGFETRHITKGASKELKDEFLDLEILNEITRQKFSGKMPAQVTSNIRHVRIAQFLSAIKGDLNIKDLHCALKWTETDAEARVSRGVTLAKSLNMDNPSTPSRKRLQTTDDTTPLKKRRRITQAVVSPIKLPKSSTINTSADQSQCHIGLIWDSINYSCAYDALITPLYNLWTIHQGKLSAFLASTSPLTHAMLGEFIQVGTGQQSLESARDKLRHILHSSDQIKFPMGHQGCDIAELCDSIFSNASIQNETSTWVLTAKCMQCTATVRHSITSRPLHLHWGSQSVEQALEQHLHAQIQLRDKCTCHRDVRGWQLQDVTTPFIVPILLNGQQVNLPQHITLFNQQLQIASVSYFTPGTGIGHYISRFLDLERRVWFHDGIQTQRWCQLEGQNISLNSVRQGLTTSNASVVFYMQV